MQCYEEVEVYDFGGGVMLTATVSVEVQSIRFGDSFHRLTRLAFGQMLLQCIGTAIPEGIP
eukprot:5714140-Amphidinium_carterae.1